MASLTEPQKRAIVERLACFETPSEVAVAMAEEFGAAFDRRQIGNFDASKPGPRQRMAKVLVELFDRTRESFRKETGGIPIANRAYRLKRLGEMEAKAREMRNYALAAELHEQAAKEMGDVYTNRSRHEMNHGGGMTIKVEYDDDPAPEAPSGAEAGRGLPGEA